MRDYKLKCKRCESSDIRKAGFVRYYTGKVEQRWECCECHYFQTKLKKNKSNKEEGK
jgi:transposase-like protein